MKLLVTAPLTPECIADLETNFQTVDYHPWTIKGAGFSEDEILKLLRETQADVLITELDDITERVITEHGKLKMIGDCRANPANIDVAACTERDIPIICTPARNAQAVAELLVGLVIEFYRNVESATQWVDEGNWIPGSTPYRLFMGNELCEKSVGFVGFGAVGRTAAGILEAFGCKICYYDPYVEHVKDSYKKQSLETIFEESDIVSIHLPVLDSTRGMINQELLSKMKSTAVFVNTARSAVVDTEALLEILKQNKIRGAILDVLDHEPPTSKDLEFNKLPNVILTPHICGASFEVINHQSDIIGKRIKKWLQKEELEKIVFNTQVLN